MTEIRGVGATVFPSKRDAWLVGVVWGSAIVSGIVALAILAAPIGAAARAALFGLCATSGAFGLWILYGTGYVFDGPLLRIACGPFRFRIPLAEIDFVAPTRSPLSSPACSLDRLEIRWRGGPRPILISPVEHEAFLNELRRRCPHLEFAGDRATRYSPDPARSA